MARMTKLDAVNIMLSAIGEAPVNYLTTGISDYSIALSVLNQIDREVQLKSWWFNTESGYRLSPLKNGEILLPKNCLSVDEKYLIKEDFCQRGGKIYDKRNHTFNLGRSISVDITLQLEFEDCPEVFKNYVAIRAARIFQDRTIGEQAMHGFQQQDEAECLAALYSEERRIGDYNFFDNRQMMESLDRNPRARPYWS